YLAPLSIDGALGLATELPRAHSSPITALASGWQSRRGSWASEHGNRFVSCDQDGQVAVWSVASESVASVAASVGAPPGGMPATCAAVRRDSLVVGRLSGMLQVYSLPSLKLRVEVASHSRWVTALDMHPSRDLVVSVAEDATLAVWQLPLSDPSGNVRHRAHPRGRSSAGKARCIFSTNWLHAMPTGVAFCGTGADCIAVTALDTEEMRMYRPI
ncbi:hypothetical protein FOA52_008411, partial [Chlamydomonas sp. UWO 241]